MDNVRTGAPCTAAIPCDDGLACNGVERCQAGRCVAGLAPRCDDADPCTLDGCTEGRGCVHQQTDACELPPSLPEDASVQPSDGGPSALLPPFDEAAPPDVPCPSSVQALSAKTQAELDRYRGITCVANGVEIGADIEDLSVLAGLRRVGSLTWLQSSERLRSLSALERIDGTLSIEAVPAEAEASDPGADLPALRWVGGEVLIRRALQPERAFAGLHYIGKHLTIVAPNTAPVARHALPALRIIGGDLRTSALGESGLPALTTVGGQLQLHRATKRQLASLSKLREVGLGLHLGGIVAQGSVVLPALERVGGVLQVQGNPELTALEVPKLERVGQLEVRLNPKLSRCQVDALTSRLVAELDQAPLICCNQGCELCAGGTCERQGAITAGQSTTLVGTTYVGMAATPTAAFASVERAETLLVDGGDPDPIESLSAPVLRHVDALMVGYTELKDLSGLSELRTLGRLTITSNRHLMSLAGLEKVESIGGPLEIASNRSLTDVSALDPARGGALRELLGTATISGNRALPACEAQALVASLAQLSDARVTAASNMTCEGVCEGPRCVPASVP